MMPNSTTLIKLAKALNVTPDYLFRPFNYTLKAIEFRKKASLTAKKTNAIELKIKDKLERYLEIENILDIKPLPLPSFSPNLIQDEKDAVRIAQETRKLLAIGNDAITNVIDMLENNGVKVLETDEPNKFDGLSGYADNSAPVIVLNNNFTTERKRFTALHELAHLILPIPAQWDRKRKEDACNAFANEMLMPAQEFKKRIGEKRHDISLSELIDIQKQYGISVDALMHKAKAENVISESRYKIFHVKKNSQPLFKQQVEQTRYPAEQSGRFQRLVYRALAQGIISTSKAAVLLQKQVEQVKEELRLV